MAWHNWPILPCTASINLSVIALRTYLILPVAILLSACQTLPPCNTAEYQQIEQRVNSTDGAGHGPDVGSEEWQSVIEFRLGVRGNPEVPARDSDEWCRFIEQQLPD